MKSIVLLFLTVMALCSPLQANAAEATALDLVGKWEGVVEFGKFSIKLVLRVAKTPEGRLAVTMDVPDQGQKGVPIPSILFNNPSVRLEIDAFGTAYNGELSSDFSQIKGAFEEGPGGRPVDVVFKKSTVPDLPEPKQLFTFEQGEPMDIRGYWKSNFELFPGAATTIGLNIGRIPDGTFKATLDLPEQGAKDIPASSVTSSNNTAQLEWKLFQGSFNAKLSDDGKTLAGGWVQRNRTNSVKFQRLDGPLSLVPKDLSYEPDKSNPQDVRGYWKGTLEVPNGKLRLVLKIGRAPDGNYSAVMASLDQGARELPASAATFNSPKAVFEWKGIRGKFEGNVNKEGTLMEGTWEQGPGSNPLKFERTATFEVEEKK